MKWNRQISPNERRKLLRIHALQELSCYDLLVRKLTAGESVSSLARWASNLGIEGQAGTWSELYWRNQLSALREKVREAKARLKPSHQPPKEVATIAEEIQKIDEEMTAKSIDPLPEITRRILNSTDKAMDEMDSPKALKYLFSRVCVRLEDQMALEKKLGMPVPNGHKIFDTAREIVDSIRKHELGERLARRVADTLPIDLPPYAAEIAEDMKQFDEVDRNLIREYGVRILTMIEEDSNGRFKVGGLDALTGRTQEAPAATGSETSGPDVTPSA
jgi:hypothetical protein